MDAPENNPDDNVAIRSASVIRVLLGSEMSSVDASRLNMVHPFHFSGFPAHHCTGTTGARPRPPDSKRRRRAPSRLLVQNGFSDVYTPDGFWFRCAAFGSKGLAPKIGV
jgi:hypothetical protein